MGHVVSNIYYLSRLGVICCIYAHGIWHFVSILFDLSADDICDHMMVLMMAMICVLIFYLSQAISSVFYHLLLCHSTGRAQFRFPYM